MAKRKSWTEKMDGAPPAQVKSCPVKFAGMEPGQAMLIPTPHLVADFVRTIPRGEARDVPAMRQALAAQHGAEVCCPVTTGIHLRIVTEAMYEQWEAGAAFDDLPPVWRVIGPNAPILKKVSFDPAFLTDRRAAEGLSV